MGGSRNLSRGAERGQVLGQRDNGAIIWINRSIDVRSIVRGIMINPSVCLCVCLSASISVEPLDRPSWNFVYRSPVAVARCSFGGVAICYVLPVLWMTSRLAVMGRTALAAFRYRGVVWCLWMLVFIALFHQSSRSFLLPANRRDQIETLTHNVQNCFNLWSITLSVIWPTLLGFNVIKVISPRPKIDHIGSGLRLSQLLLWVPGKLPVSYMLTGNFFNYLPVSLRIPATNITGNSRTLLTANILLASGCFGARIPIACCMSQTQTQFRFRNCGIWFQNCSFLKVN